MEVPERVREKRDNKLAKMVEQRLLDGWVADNFENFKEVMECIRENSPIKYADLYVKVANMVAPKQQDVNININSKSDYDQLVLMSKTKIKPTLGGREDVVDYEEIVPAGIPLKKEGGF